MKKSSLFTALLTFFIIHSAGGRVVTQPKADVSGSLHSMIRSVELTDTATRFNMSMLHQPGYWCQIDTMILKGHSTGKIYPLIRAEGYVIGEQKHVGENGRHDYTLVFPPLEIADTLVDMHEQVIKSEDIYLGIHLSDKQPVGKYRTHIHGRHNGKSGFMTIMKSGPRPEDPLMTIPVDNGEFSADFFSEQQEFYKLLDGGPHFTGRFLFTLFMPENETLEVTVEADEHGEATHITTDAPEGTQTHAFLDLEKKRREMWNNSAAVKYRDSLENAKAYYKPRLYELEELNERYPEKRDSIRSEMEKFWTKDAVDTPLTLEGQVAEQAVSDFIQHDIKDLVISEASGMANLAGLFALIHEMWFERDASRYLNAWRKVYSDKFAGHPYTLAFEAIDTSSEPIIGNPYNDFAAPDFAGKEHNLSSLIEGHPALIDLWASWCGPCRRGSKSMIPVYNDYEPKGFRIVGVARETAVPDLAKEAVEKDGYPWINLVDVDDKIGIWALYRRQNAAGGTFLVDAAGKIVAIDPTAEEVRAYLESLYGANE